MSLNHDVQTDVDKITQLINDMSTRISIATQEMVEKVKSAGVATTAQ